MGRSTEILRYKTAVIGFDGAVDTRVRIIEKAGKKSASGNEPEVCFSSLSGFGGVLAAHTGKNCSFELKKISEHFGGNAPFVSNALARMGVQSTCIGLMGVPKPHTAFDAAEGIKISYGENASTLALEFDDGKTFLEQNPDIPDAWERICTNTKPVGGPEKLFSEADLLAMVNWSELSFADRLWKDVFRCCFADGPADLSKFVFFDLCDVSRRRTEECRQILSLISEFSKKRNTVLGLNQNELEQIGKAIGEERGTESICLRLRKEYGLGEILVHTRKKNELYTGQDEHLERPVCVVEQPAVLTGAGDHFSAAYCASLLMGLPARERLEFAAAYAAEYVRTGVTPEPRNGAEKRK